MSPEELWTAGRKLQFIARLLFSSTFIFITTQSAKYVYLHFTNKKTVKPRKLTNLVNKWQSQVLRESPPTLTTSLFSAGARLPSLTR